MKLIARPLFSVAILVYGRVEKHEADTARQQFPCRKIEAEHEDAFQGDNRLIPNRAR
jgi:hypothetical protein